MHIHEHYYIFIFKGKNEILRVCCQKDLVWFYTLFFIIKVVCEENN